MQAAARGLPFTTQQPLTSHCQWLFVLEQGSTRIRSERVQTIVGSYYFDGSPETRYDAVESFCEMGTQFTYSQITTPVRMIGADEFARAGSRVDAALKASKQGTGQSRAGVPLATRSAQR
ncbi:MAG: hypothetical protein KGJ80_02170 [Chloroflexota bacterium]|nr:hypothetical protein [Chloroflexota bacterium]